MENKAAIQFPNLLVAKAYDYYLKGLNAKETGKLLDVSPRTVQRYAKAYRFKERATPGTIRQRVAHLHAQGYSYKEIAGIIGKSRSTVYNYLKSKA